jgi:16S rRNA (cytosine967-C5)-methyltransferase
VAEQDMVLEQAADFVKPGGVLAYATCSLLPAENGERIAVFLKAHPDFHPQPMRPVWDGALPGISPPEGALGETSLLLTPRRSGTDGFFVACLRRGD